MQSSDAFASFLAYLAESLDEHGASSEELAARVHLSRFHFDRLVSAAAGEPPAAFRRRVLLERAAHRLITSRDEVLPVALDAGYASHEAFTRAFSQAFGETPSRWRRTPTSFRLDAASNVHFHPPGGLHIPTDRKVTGMDLLTRMIEHHVWLVAEMLVRAEPLSDSVLDEPIDLSVEGIDDEPTLRSLLARLVGQIAMWDAAIESEPYDVEGERGRTIAELRAALAVVGPMFVERVRTIGGEGRFDETFVDATCSPPRVFTYGGMVAHVLTFAAHRRTLVCGALHDAGMTDLGSGDPMLWVAAA